MVVVTEAPGQGDELAGMSRQDKETREHEETATATAIIVLDDNVTALQPGGSERGRARRTTVERGTRMQNPQCVIP